MFNDGSGHLALWANLIFNNFIINFSISLKLDFVNFCLKLTESRSSFGKNFLAVVKMNIYLEWRSGLLTLLNILLLLDFLFSVASLASKRAAEGGPHS